MKIFFANESEVYMNNTDSEMVFMTSVDVAKALGCSLPTARALMKRRDFPLIRVGKNMKVSYDAFVKWSEERHI